MRIVIPVIDFGRGGGYRVLSRLASEWSRTTEVQFIAPAFAAEPYFPTDAGIVHVNAHGRVVARETRDLAGFSRVSRAQIALTRGLRRNALPGDVILSNHFLTTLAANGVRSEGTTHVRLMQATEADYYPGDTVRARAFRLLAERADAKAPFVLVNSPEFLVDDRRRIGFIPPGVVQELFHPPPPRQPRPLVLGTIGRSEPWKGTDRVLSALRVCDLPEDARISVANFGADLSAFGDLPIDESVPGRDSDLASWYRDLDIYVVGAYGQQGGYHYPCLEALSCGVTLITPWYRPADESNSWVVESSDPSHLASGINAALSDPDERARRRQAGLITVEKHAWPVIAQQALSKLVAASEYGCPDGSP